MSLTQNRNSNLDVPVIDVSPNIKAAIYARKSILNDNNSIESQISIAKSKIFEKNLILHEIYKDEISSTEFSYDKRSGFTKLLNDAETGLFKTVVVFRRDRLARNVYEFKQIQRIFAKHGVEVIYSNDGEYQNKGSNNCDFVENIIIAMDELEATLIKKRTSAGIIKKRERGEYSSGGKCALFGYGRKIEEPPNSNNKEKQCDIKKNTIYFPVEPQATYVKEIFKRYINLGKEIHYEVYTRNQLLEEIEKLANDMSLKEDPPVYIPTYDIEYIRKHLNDIIENPVYAGYIFKASDAELKDIVVKDSNDEFTVDETKLILCTNVKPILLDRETWDDAVLNRMLTYKARTKTTETYLFKGFLSCSECKKNITLRRDQKADRNKFVCSCGHINILASNLTDKVIEKVISDIFTEDKIKSYMKTKRQLIRDDIKGYTKKLNEIKANQTRDILHLAESISTNSSTKLRNFENELKIINENIEKEDILKSNKVMNQNNLSKLNRSTKYISKIRQLALQNDMKQFFIDNIDKVQNLLSNMIEKVIISAEEPNKEEFEYRIEYGKKYSDRLY
jgi:DNA invertase Pin-like site-specific DNA recombinase